jgi:Fe-S-cluster containining protein
MECSCTKCVALCERNPGWTMPEEAIKLMDLGYGPRMMLDWYSKLSEDIFILAPASIGYEGKNAPDINFLSAVSGGWCKGRCTMLTEDGLCEIHNSGAKPLHCREASACGKQKDVHSTKEVSVMWDTDLGRQTVKRWKQEVGF